MKKKMTTPISEEHKRYLSKRKKTKIAVRILQWGILILLFGLWELLTAFNVIDSFIFSSPSKIWNMFSTFVENGTIWRHIGATLYETVLSFVLATVLGTVIAVLLWRFETARRVVEPYIVVLNSLPKIALGPIIIIWVGAGRAAIITMALLISLIITVISILSGFLEVEKDKLLLMNTFGANKWQILTRLIIPANVPTIISALKINVGMSWVGTIMGEYLVSKEGLGYLIVYGGQVFNLSLVMTSTVILCVLATLMYGAVALLEKEVKKRRQ